MGPRSRELLGRLTDARSTTTAFPFATSQAARRSRAPVRATRMTYVGELGWELLVPRRRGGAVYDALCEPATTSAWPTPGTHAIESLRLEKGYRAFGRELTPDYTPVEAGLVFATALSGDKDFLGRAALADAATPPGGRSPPSAGVVRRRRPRRDAVGRRAGAAARRAGRPGHQRGVRRHGRRERRARLPAPRPAGHLRLARPTAASRSTWPATAPGRPPP